MISYNTYNTILIDLDLLFDTRMSLLKELSPKMLEEMLEDLSYYKRLGNNFKSTKTKATIPDNYFDMLYRYRNKMLLKEARHTLLLETMPSILNDFTDMHKEDNALTPIMVLINIYPYELNDEELAIIKVFLAGYLPNIIAVEFTRLDPIDITHKKLTDHKVKEMYMYNGLAWLCYMLNTGQYLKTPMFNKILHIPDSRMISLYANELRCRDNNELFTLLANYINVELLPTVLTCDAKYFPNESTEETDR